MLSDVGWLWEIFRIECRNLLKGRHKCNMVRKPRMLTFYAAVFVLVVACASSTVAGTLLDADQMKVVNGGCTEICAGYNPCSAPYCDPLVIGNESPQCSSSNIEQTCVTHWLGSNNCKTRIVPGGGYCGLKCIHTECHIVSLIPIIGQCSGGVPIGVWCDGEECSLFGFQF